MPGFREGLYEKLLFMSNILFTFDNVIEDDKYLVMRKSINEKREKYVQVKNSLQKMSNN